MSQRALTTTLRTLLPSTTQRICRRCLATQPPAPSHTRPPLSPIDHRTATRSQLLSTPLPQPRIPDHYLQHVDASTLPISEQEQWEKVAPHKKTIGVVVSHGKMDKTVRVRVAGMRWSKAIKKYYRADTTHLVHDPHNSLVTGDVIELHRLRVSTRVEHVVAKIVSPFGSAIEERAPIPSAEERLAEYKRKRFAKFERREGRRMKEEEEGEQKDGKKVN